MKSVNNFTLSGRLTADAKALKDNAGASFSIAHNMGKNNKPLYEDFVIFSTKNGKETAIDWNLLKKGTPVVVSAYRRDDSYTDANGHLIRKNQWVVKKIEAITPEEADTDDASDNENGSEE